MKLISWNVNGMRSILTKGFEDFLNNVNADIFSVQETKMQQGQVEILLSGYNQYWNSAIKKGYSGTAVFIKNNIKVKSVKYGIGIQEHDQEGRVITLELDNIYIVNVYTPNSKRELERLEYRMVWENEFRTYLNKLNSIKPVIICGDMNVAHKEIDLRNPKTNTHNAGFTLQECNKMTMLLDSGFVDSFRLIYPNKEGAYTWWSYMHNARDKNIGWRIDYFLVSESIKEKIRKVQIFDNIYGSDHCPVGLEINI